MNRITHSPLREHTFYGCVPLTSQLSLISYCEYVGEIKDQSPENFDIYEPLPWRIFEMRESLEDAMQFLSSASLVTEIEMEESVEGPVLSFVSRLRDWNTSFLDLWNTWKTGFPLIFL